MLTPYDLNKKTIFDLILPTRFKDNIDPLKLISLANSNKIFYTKEDFGGAFSNLTIDELYELRESVSVINAVYGSSTKYNIYPIVEKNKLHEVVSKYIRISTSNDLVMESDSFSVTDDYIDEIESTMKDDELLYEVKQVNDKKVLYIGDELLLAILKEDSSSFVELSIKLEGELIDLFRDKLLGNNPSEPDAYMLPHYLNWNRLVSIKMNEKMNLNNENMEER